MSKPARNPITILLFLLLGAPAGARQAATPAADRFQMPVPQSPDRHARFLIYLHGRIIEELGIRPTDPRYGTYEYVEILKALERKGFIVISEHRPKGTDPEQYARVVTDQVGALLRAGVPPAHITVVGASKGAVIAMLASTRLHNRDVNFVLLANCNDWVRESLKPDLYGNVLSIYDEKDDFGRSCERIFADAKGLNRSREVELHLGTGHAVLYKPLKEWVDLVDEWARLPAK